MQNSMSDIAVATASLPDRTRSLPNQREREPSTNSAFTRAQAMRKYVRPHMGKAEFDCEALVRLLSDEFGICRLAADACSEAGVPERAEQVAYCMAAAVRRAVADGKPTEWLPDSAGFRAELTSLAAKVAAAMRQWAADYETIHDEFLGVDVTTVLELIRVSPTDDVVAVAALDIAEIVAGGPRLDEMALDDLCGEPPAANAYLFRGSLPGWIARAVWRDPQPWTEPFEKKHEDRRRTAGPEDDAAEKKASEMIAELVARVARLAATRGLLGEVIAAIQALEDRVPQVGEASGADPDELFELRAYLLEVAAMLEREQLALTGMLAYVALALRGAAQRQVVALLSLRLAAIEPEAIDAMDARMRAIVADGSHPSPLLVARTERAVAAGVPAARAAALRTLREHPRRRAAELAPVARLLDELPPVVADLASLSGVAGAGMRVVIAHRSGAATELTAVDPLYGRAFRRYAMGKA
jgi:hypothetical protein